MFFEHVLQLPLSYYTGSHSGRLVKVMMTGTNTLWALWLAFFREHFASLVSLIVLLPLTLFINWRYGLLLIVLCCIFAMLIALVVSKSEQLQSTVERYYSRRRRAHHRHARKYRTGAELRPHRERSLGHEEDGRRGARRPDPGAVVVGGDDGDHAHIDHADDLVDPHARRLVLSPRSHHGRRNRDVHELRDAADRPARTRRAASPTGW